MAQTEAAEAAKVDEEGGLAAGSSAMGTANHSTARKGLAAFIAVRTAIRTQPRKVTVLDGPVLPRQVPVAKVTERFGVGSMPLSSVRSSSPHKTGTDSSTLRLMTPAVSSRHRPRVSTHDTCGSTESEEWSTFCNKMSSYRPGAYAAKRAPAAQAGGPCTGCVDSASRESNVFEAVVPLNCTECSNRQSVGTFMYGCNDCDRRLCGQCHRQEEQDADLIMLTMLQLGGGSVSSASSPERAGGKAAAVDAELPDDLPAIHEDSAALAEECPEEWEPRLKNLEKEYPEYAGHILLRTLTETDGHAGKAKKYLNSMLQPQEYALGRGSIEDGTGDRNEHRRNVVKLCALCEKPYSGFGDKCGDCRRSGQLGAFSQCRWCDEFFQGFGDTCEECHAKGQGSKEGG